MCMCTRVLSRHFLVRRCHWPARPPRPRESTYLPSNVHGKSSTSTLSGLPQRTSRSSDFCSSKVRLQGPERLPSVQQDRDGDSLTNKYKNSKDQSEWHGDHVTMNNGQMPGVLHKGTGTASLDMFYLLHASIHSLGSHATMVTAENAMEPDNPASQFGPAYSNFCHGFHHGRPVSGKQLHERRDDMDFPRSTTFPFGNPYPVHTHGWASQKEGSPAAGMPLEFACSRSLPILSSNPAPRQSRSMGGEETCESTLAGIMRTLEQEGMCTAMSKPCGELQMRRAQANWQSGR
jgi:hypothetical protein